MTWVEPKKLDYLLLPTVLVIKPFILAYAR